MRISSKLLMPGMAPNVLTVEASTLGLRPGSWPEHIDVYVEATNGTVRFVKTSVEMAGEDVAFVKYAKGEAYLNVLND